MSLEDILEKEKLKVEINASQIYRKRDGSDIIISYTNKGENISRNILLLKPNGGYTPISNVPSDYRLLSISKEEICKATNLLKNKLDEKGLPEAYVLLKMLDTLANLATNYTRFKVTIQTTFERKYVILMVFNGIVAAQRSKITWYSYTARMQIVTFVGDTTRTIASYSLSITKSTRHSQGRSEEIPYITLHVQYPFLASYQ